MSATADTIEMFRREDAKLEDALQYVVPIKHGTNNLWGPATYEDKGMPAIWEKRNYLGLLAPGAALNPTIEITQEDIDTLKNKAYMQTEYDFNNYVGELIKPDTSPANKAFLQKIYPAWFDKQRKTIETWHDTKKKIENLLLMGPKSQEDLFMLYRLGYSNTTGIAPTKKDEEQQMGKFDELVKQVTGQAPGISWKAQSAEETAMNFQRGLFNQDRRNLMSKAMMGFPRSVFPGEYEAAGPKTITPATLQPRLKPFGDGYPKPGFWGDYANDAARTTAFNAKVIQP